MAKGSLANQLIGKIVVPKPELGDPLKKDDPNWRIWAGLQPNLSGEWLAIIDAVWTEDTVVKMAVHDPRGATANLYFTNVNLKL